MLGYRKSAALTLIALPLLLGACSSSSGRTEEDTDRSGANWIVVSEGNATPSPSETMGTASPTPSTTLPALPTGTATPTAAPDPSCTPRRQTTMINGVGVVPSSTSAVVTWYHPGGSDIVDYRITAISQDLRVGAQEEVGWTRSAPEVCGEVSATVSGLSAGTPYVFSVDVVKTRKGMDGTYTTTVARSGVVSTT
ncbi:fibronectin type III domain-containing protein [Actinoplanes utahensis]|uniref:Fibronectin type-III domain-containing protein n=1 Tax=Actinoplanes utahensis TaxID=1869 RepID=A0A0A6UPD6_ACTUT|nr:fibronectin type III domain-containing protein [Actinoplanes utahensis]KHD76179.1 hypothetical protein MB27_18800 [Actinoplanes utahensis]GIF28700.1 hypothetical protein Aut01nite_16860 [Actinoplanes utahensis]